MVEGIGSEMPTVFSVIVHASPRSDRGCMYWTELPEFPAANEGGRTSDEALERTRAVIHAKAFGNRTQAGLGPKLIITYVDVNEQ
jgi:hypothetical protein